MIRRFAALAAFAATAPAFAAPPIAGRWLTTDGSAVIAIGDCGGSLCGRIARVLKGPPNGAPMVDAMNPDPKLKSRALIGTPILTGLTPDGAGWTGQIYDPKTGKSYRAIVARAGGKLKVQGCLSVFCRTMLWTVAG